MVTLRDCVFAWMCREFAPLLGVCEAELRPDTPLDRFLPADRRREFWRTAGRELNLRFPELFPPQRMQRFGQWMFLGSVARSIALVVLLGFKWFAFPLALGVLAFTTWAYDLVTRPWATEHPEIATFGDLANWLLACNVKKFRRMFDLKPNSDEIFLVIKAMLTEQLGVDPRQVTPESSFVELLGE